MTKRSRSLSPQSTRRSREPCVVPIEPSPQHVASDQDSLDSCSDDEAFQGDENFQQAHQPDERPNRKRRHASSRSASDKSDDESTSDHVRKKPKVLQSAILSVLNEIPVVQPTPSISKAAIVKSDRPVVLVLDTNILLEEDGLIFLGKLVRNEFDDVVPNLQVIVPHIVFLELDKQKSRRQGDLAYRARCAVRFLADSLCDELNATAALGVPSTSRPVRSTRIAGQTLAEFTAAAKLHDANAPIADDHFLFCCLQYQERQSLTVAIENAATVIIAVSNDKILRCRCCVNLLKTQSLGSLLDNIDKKRAGRQSLFDWPQDGLN